MMELIKFFWYGRKTEPDEAILENALKEAELDKQRLENFEKYLSIEKKYKLNRENKEYLANSLSKPLENLLLLETNGKLENIPANLNSYKKSAEYAESAKYKESKYGDNNGLTRRHLWRRKMAKF